MNYDLLHPWNINPREAVAIQKKLSKHIVAVGKPRKVEYIAGIDVAFDKEEKIGYCAVIVFRFSTLEIVEECFGSCEIHFPYVPGLLSFREAPLILQVLKSVQHNCDCLIFDGQGIAHPRKFGIASHVGLLLGIPSIGCAKSKLYGHYEEPPNLLNARSYLFDENNFKIGVVLRTKLNTKPIFVSPGHLVGIDEAADIVYSCTDGYRIPVPTRLAHSMVGKYKKRNIYQ
ncbi:MAG: endonuclease V [Spirochaetes bacterium]|nr:endonuclease V [Spirochaetota bacterium]